MDCRLQVYCLFLLSLSVSNGEEVASCTHGFTSKNRMDILLDGGGDVKSDDHYRGILTDAHFTCNGKLLGWVFGASWEGNFHEFTALDIWRVGENSEVYEKVGSTTIKTPESTSNLYYYYLSTPLDFQQGDVIGYYQPQSSRSQLRLLYEEGEGELQVGYYFSSSNAQSNLVNIRNGEESDRYNMFINVITEPEGCSSGFMSVERMRLLLRLEPISEVAEVHGVQQINPGMFFTCNGFITKWLVSIKIQGKVDFSPELQVWTQINSTSYIKKNGTVIDISLKNTENVKELITYTDFEPIPVESGDIVGVFVPQSNNSITASLLFKKSGSLTSYYVTASDYLTSAYKELNVQENMRQSNDVPLVSAEIAVLSSSSTNTQLMVLSSTILSSNIPTDTNVDNIALVITLILTAFITTMCACVNVVCTIVCLAKRRKRKNFMFEQARIPTEVSGSRGGSNSLPYYSYPQVARVGRGTNSRTVLAATPSENSVEMAENIAYE